MSAPIQSSTKTKLDSRAAKTRRVKNRTRRTTVSLSPASVEVVEEFKAATGLSTSRAIDELIVWSVPRPPRIKMVNGRAVFDLPMEITTEEILHLEDLPW